jgi:hypothetical protein
MMGHALREPKVAALAGSECRACPTSLDNIFALCYGSALMAAGFPAAMTTNRKRHDEQTRRLQGT